jgi:hypothetical protein
MNRLGWALAGALAITVVAVLARATQAGPLDPPGPVASTMKTIGDLVPAWHQTLTSSGCGSARWSWVMGGAAVLDNETGLVWEKTPAQGPNPVAWSSAVKFCGTNGTGGRYGWRLPTSEELGSLLDPTGFSVMTGSPFTGISATLGYWSSTTVAGAELNAIAIGFGGGPGGSVNKDEGADFTFWCVRGQHGFDAPAPNDAGAWSKVLTANAPDNCRGCCPSAVPTAVGLLVGANFKQRSERGSSRYPARVPTTRRLPPFLCSSLASSCSSLPL